MWRKKVGNHFTLHSFSDLIEIQTTPHRERAIKDGRRRQKLLFTLITNTFKFMDFFRSSCGRRHNKKKNVLESGWSDPP